MKRSVVHTTAWIVLSLALAACQSTQPKSTVTSSGGSDIGTKRAERYDGPKARIAIAEFEDKTVGNRYYRKEYGRGMSDMLTTALVNTNRFIVLEREKLKAVTSEQNLGASGRVKFESAPQIGELYGAELLIIGAVTAFDPGTEGTQVGGGGLLGKVLGGATGGYKKARIAMDLRLVDTRTGVVVAATSVAGEATSVNFKGGAIGGGFVGGLSTYSKTPMGAAIRDMLNTAVNYIVERTPQKFYHYSPTGEPLNK